MAKNKNCETTHIEYIFIIIIICASREQTE